MQLAVSRFGRWQDGDVEAVTNSKYSIKFFTPELIPGVSKDNSQIYSNAG